MAKVLDFSPVDAKLDRANFVPTNLVQSDKLSNTSYAYECLVNQQFSSTLQVFLVNYVMSISSFYGIYK